MIEQWHKETCKCCHGMGTQQNKITGLTILCPCCGGSGQRNVSNMEGLPPGSYSMTSSGGSVSKAHSNTSHQQR